MKYLPLVWAALWRKPVRMILTLLSVSVAFTLFGMMIGFNASVQHLLANSRLNMAYVNTRFGGTLPLAYESQIARLPNVNKIVHIGGVPGYYRERKNTVFVLMASDSAQDVMTVFPLTPAQWHQLASSRTGVLVSRNIAERYHLKPGDAFPVISAAATRRDGSKVWPFAVTDVVGDVPQQLNGYVLGNYAYLDEARPLAQRGAVLQFQFLVKDPDRVADTAKAIDAMFANSPVPTDSVTERAAYEAFAQAGINIPFVTTIVAGAGLFMILFLTGNVIAQSVRERIPEFAVMKTLGFSDARVTVLVVVEAAIPCLCGAAIGLGLATALATRMPQWMPPNSPLPVPYMSWAVLGLALAFAVLVAFASAVLPVLRVRRLDVAAALSGR
jgi:putative ABC transport system permease protein